MAARNPKVHRPASAASKSAAEYTFKVLMLGDASVGKTSLLSKFVDGKLARLSETATVGIDLAKKTLHIDGHDVKLLIWDTAGQEKFRSITRSFYRDANAVVLCYDTTREGSFLGIRSWLREIADQSPECDILLLATKSDMTDERAIAAASGKALAKELDVPFFETSAVTGQNIEDSFLCLARLLLRRVLPPPADPKSTAAATTPSVLAKSADVKVARPTHSKWNDKADTVDLTAIKERGSEPPASSGCGC